MEITKDDKYRLFGWKSETLKEHIRTEMFKEKGIILNESELDITEEAIMNNIVVGAEEPEQQETVKLSLQLYNGKVVVLKAKKLSVKEMVSNIVDAANMFGTDYDFVKVYYAISIALRLFVTALEDEEGDIYCYLTYLCMHKEMKIDNIEIYNVIKEYYRKNYEEDISNRRIDKILNVLENKIKVIEFRDGYLEIKDKIYFD